MDGKTLPAPAHPSGPRPELQPKPQPAPRPGDVDELIFSAPAGPVIPSSR